MPQPIQSFDGNRVLLGSDGFFGFFGFLCLGAYCLLEVTNELTERIILAPEATDKVRSQVESDLDDAGVDIPIVESRLYSTDPPSRGYVSRLAGADNYGGREDYLEEILEHFVEETREQLEEEPTD